MEPTFCTDVGIKLKISKCVYVINACRRIKVQIISNITSTDTEVTDVSIKSDIITTTHFFCKKNTLCLFFKEMHVSLNYSEKVVSLLAPTRFSTKAFLKVNLRKSFMNGDFI